MPRDFHICVGLRDEKLLGGVYEILSGQFTITALSQGNDIINCVLERQPDLAFLDATISEIDILTLCERLYADYPLIRIVLYVHLDRLHDIKKKWHKRAMDYSIGPLGVEELTSDILKVIRYIIVEREREQLKRDRIETEFCVKQALLAVEHKVAEVTPESANTLKDEIQRDLKEIRDMLNRRTF